MKKQLSNLKRNLICILIGSLFLTGILPAPFSVSTAAKSVVVTSKLERKSGIKNICKYTNMYVQVMAEGGNKKKTITRMTENSKANLLCLAIAGMPGSSFISSNDFLEDGQYRAIKANPFKKQFKKLYGNIPDLNKIKITNNRTKKNNGNLYVSVGDWGEDSPCYKISRIVRTDSKKYTITIKNQKKVYETGRRYTIGTTTIKIKASKKSSYGYIITGIKYRITSNIY